MDSRLRGWFPVALIALGVLGLFFYFMSRPPPVPAPTLMPSRPEPLMETRPEPRGARPIATITPGQRIADAAERARISRELLAAQKARQAAVATSGASGNRPTAASEPSDSPDDPGLDKDYLRERMREIVPLVKECYELALKKNPQLQGRLMVHFSIVAEPEIGGLVDSSQVERDGPLGRDPILGECVQETMYALKLKAPRGGGKVEVSYPFVFKVDDEAEGGAPPKAP